MKLLKSFPALSNSEKKSDDDATQIEAKFTAPEEPARNRVTKVYANKRSSKKFCGNSSVNSGGPPKGAEADGTGGASPHREVSSQLGVNGFLDRLMSDHQTKETEQSQEAMTLSPPCNNTMSNTPLTPTKSIKQKRFPGKLALPVAEQKGKLKEKKSPTSPATSTVTFEGKEKVDDGIDWHAGQTIGGSDDKQSIQSDDGKET